MILLCPVQDPWASSFFLADQKTKMAALVSYLRRHFLLLCNLWTELPKTKMAALASDLLNHFQWASTNVRRAWHECLRSLCYSPSVRLSIRIGFVDKNFNLGHKFKTITDRDFILHICIPCDKTFHMVPNFFTLWPWPWSLTYFWKALILAITVIPEEIGFSNFSCVFLVTRPFSWYHNLWPWLWNLTYFSKL